MTSNVKRHVQLPRSSQKGKVPTADDLKYGEIAVNFNKEEPFIAIKGSDDSIITMDFKNAEKGPWNKGEGEHSAVLGNETSGSPTEIINTATGKYATAEGNGTKASGNNSHSEGLKTNANGNHSHAEGNYTTASGDTSHAEGNYTIVKGGCSHAEGKYMVKMQLAKDIAVGDTKITVDNDAMNLPVIDEYIKNCFIRGKNNPEDIYNIVSYSTDNFSGVNVIEFTLDKPLETASSNSGSYDDYPSFTSNEYILTNIAVGEVEAGHAEGKNNIVLGEAGHAEGIMTIAKGTTSHSEGSGTTASGDKSHAEGSATTASGETSHAEGSNTNAVGNFSHAEGNSTSASGPQSHAEGSTTFARGESSHAEGSRSTASGVQSHAEGSTTTASGPNSHSEGNGTTASGDTSHAEGLNTKAIGNYSHAEGRDTTTSGAISHAEGFGSKASGESSHAEGSSTIASGAKSHAEGNGTTAGGTSSHAEGINSKANGDYSHAEGYSNTASGECSHAEGSSTIASGAKSHTEGVNTKAVGNFSHAEGSDTNSAAHYSHVEGSGGIALSVSSHVEGLHLNGLQITDDITAGSTEMFILASEDYSVNLDYYKNCIIANKDRTSAIDVLNAEYAYNTKFTADNENKRIKLTLKDPLPKACTRAAQITGYQRDGYFYTWEYAIQNKGTIESYGSHAEGSYTMVYEDAGHAEGKLSISKGKISHAEGYRTIAGGKYSHSEGINTTASGESSHAEGSNTTASGKDSHASGLATLASNQSEFACGQYNKANTNQIFSVGIGTADNARKNAIYITTDGSISGDVQLTNGGTSMTGLKILGGIQATNGMIAPTYLNSSDERLKKDIETISENDIDKVKNVDLKSYAFKSDNSKHFGVIAQDVERAGLEELVVSSTEGIKSVDYISLLILKIAELENEIKNLKEQIKK